MHEIMRQKCLPCFFFFFFFLGGEGFFQRHTTEAPELIFTYNRSNDVVLLELEDKNLTSKLCYSRKKTPIWGPIMTALENFQAKTALQWGCSM